jgi:hypothetical protein
VSIRLVALEVEGDVADLVDAEQGDPLELAQLAAKFRQSYEQLLSRPHEQRTSNRSRGCPRGCDDERLFRSERGTQCENLADEAPSVVRNRSATDAASTTDTAAANQRLSLDELALRPRTNWRRPKPLASVDGKFAPWSPATSQKQGSRSTSSSRADAGTTSSSRSGVLTSAADRDRVSMNTLVRGAVAPRPELRRCLRETLTCGGPESVARERRGWK